ncbi:MAG: XRE family transcriptional regulator [Oscillospiraceae bacterium]|nr:XRE family transcriptional regulator [Oscillospiraceae bacterium]
MKHRSRKPGDKNIIGAKVLAYRIANDIKQKDFLAQLQVLGLDISSTSLSRLEWQERLVQDREIIIIAIVMKTDPNELLDWKDAVALR